MRLRLSYLSTRVPVCLCFGGRTYWFRHVETSFSSQRHSRSGCPASVPSLAFALAPPYPRVGLSTFISKAVSDNASYVQPGASSSERARPLRRGEQHLRSKSGQVRATRGKSGQVPYLLRLAPSCSEQASRAAVYESRAEPPRSLRYETTSCLSHTY